MSDGTAGFATLDDLLIDEFKQVLPADAVTSDPEVLAKLARTTGVNSTLPVLVVYPRSAVQVQDVVRIAARVRAKLYPISGGRNWGYGDACAPSDHCVIVDLSRMNRILEVNSELAYAVVEPGVTQGQLSRYLIDHKLPLSMDLTGAGPDASLVGNLLERGVGLSRYSDRFANTCALHVVMPDGELLKTGFGAYPNAQAANLIKHGVGPGLDSLFSQSNLGIVVQGTVWLMPRPQCIQPFFISLPSDRDIGPLIDALRELRLAGTLRCSVHCFNDLRLLGGHMRFPWEQADGSRALEHEHPALTRELLARHGIPPWMATGTLTGTAVEVRAAQKVVRSKLRAVAGARIQFVDSTMLGRMNRLLGLLPQWSSVVRLRHRLQKAGTWLDFLGGIPTHQTLAGAHWRARKAAGPDQDPRDSNAGLLWLAPVLPMTSSAVSRATRLGKDCFQKYGFEYQVTISMLSERSVCQLMSIHFDRGNRAETERAQKCHDELLDKLLHEGFVPYRCAPLALPRLHRAAPQFWHTTQLIKSAIDPLEVIAPGRYIPPNPAT